MKISIRYTIESVFAFLWLAIVAFIVYYCFSRWPMSFSEWLGWWGWWGWWIKSNWIILLG